MRVAWFSPLPPVRSGVASYSAELVPRLARLHTIDRYDVVARPGAAASAHDFVWRHRRAPYDLVVYQLGNAPCHDFVWAYLVRYPGLVVLHDARLHQARARQLLRAGRAGDYRAELAYDQPDAPAGLAEYAVNGLGGLVNALWPMRRVVLTTARMTAVHNRRIADELREAHPEAAVETIRMGVPPPAIDPAARARLRRTWGIGDTACVFAAFGKVTPEKRLDAVARAIGALVRDGIDAHLLIVGEGDGGAPGGIAGRVHATGFVEDAAIGDALSASDACVCLRWPTAGETSASWLRCLAAGRATVITRLPHLADIPTVDPSTWRRSHASREPAAIAIDLLGEDAALAAALRRLATDPGFRAALARTGHEYWRAHHTLDLMVEDYERLLPLAAARPAPQPSGLPAHFTDDYSDRARGIAGAFGVDLDILR
jgi:glycosyltransferase involved in cell wall biosynthesis